MFFFHSDFEKIVLRPMKNLSYYLGAESGIHERRLLTDLLDNSGYNKLERPVINESEAVVLSFGLTLQQIIDVVRIVKKICTIVIKILDYKELSYRYQTKYGDS